MFAEILILHAMCFVYEMYILNRDNRKKLFSFGTILFGKNNYVKKDVDFEDNSEDNSICFEIRHGGNQDIPELKDGNSVEITIMKNLTIGDLKKEIENRVKYATPDSQILRTGTFGTKLDDDLILSDCQVKVLFITILNY